MKSPIKLIVDAISILVVSIVIASVGINKAIAESTGTVHVEDQQNHIDKTYHHAKVVNFNHNPENSDATPIIITQSGQRIKPSNNAQITYSSSARDIN